MLTLEQFDQAMERAANMDRLSRQMLADSKNIEEAAYKKAGLECHHREPGFPCWTHQKIIGYFNTPRQALEAAIAAKR
jgi:hypothetical protein